MNRRIITGLIVVLVVAGFLMAVFSLNKPQPASEFGSGKMLVTASFYPLYFFAQQIGGDKAEVVNITPAAIEPHDYEPTPQDMVTIRNSRMVILNGGGLESWANDLQKIINTRQTVLLTVGDSLVANNDPHAWLSPILARKMVDKISASFVQVDPANAQYYEANATVLKNQLTKLDAEYRHGLENCQSRDIITTHTAFGYLASTYGFKQVAIAGISPDAEPSVAQLASLVQFAKANRIRYIFSESLISPKLAETIAREVGAQTLVLNPLEGLTADELARGDNYFTVMRSNLKNLQLALQCKN